MNKSKADKKLNLSYLNFKHLTDKDRYLGILFTRNRKEYYNSILEEFNKKFDINIKLTWINILNILESNKNDRSKIDISNIKKINGFMRYKLSPFIKNLDIITYIKIINDIMEH